MVTAVDSDILGVVFVVIRSVTGCCWGIDGSL